MLVLSRHDVEQLLTMPDAIAAVEDGFRQLALGNVTMPQRLATTIQPHNGLHLAMPAFVGGSDGEAGTLTIKIVTVFGDNPARYGEATIQGVVLLHDAQTGRPLALLDAEHLTAMRTGAASGVATKHLARPDASRVLLFGAGAQAATQLLGVAAVRPVQQVAVVALNPDGGQAFADRMAALLGVPVAPAQDVQAAVAEAEIICTATTSTTPLFDGAWLAPGTHVNAIGAYTRAMRELDTTTIQRSRLFVDGRQAAQAEAGDIVIPLAEGAITLAHIAAELGSVVNGQAAGRRSPEEITVFKSVGMAVQDAVAAARVYARARERGLGQEIQL